MRPSIVAASVAAAIVPTVVTSTSFAQEEDEAYTTETVVYSQRRLVMAPTLVRPELVFFLQNLPGTGDNGDDEIGVGFGVKVDWTPIDKLQVGATASPRLSPETDANDPSIYARYLLLDKAPVQLALQAGYTFTDPSPGSIQLGVPLRIPLTPAARLDVSPFVYIDLPNDNNGDKVWANLSVPLSLGVSLTRALYLDVMTGFDLPHFDGDLASMPLGLEVGYSIKGGEESAFIDILLRFRFDSFIRPNAPEGVDAVNTDNWFLGLGARAHFGYE